MQLFNGSLNQSLKLAIKKPVLAFGLSSAIAQLFTMVYMLLLARYLGPDKYGTYIAPFAIANLTSILINQGLDTWLLRTDSIKTPVLDTTGKVFKLKLLTGVVWGVLLWIIAPGFRPDLYPLLLLMLCILDVWSDSLLHTLLASLNVVRKIKNYSLMLLFSRGIRLISLLVLMLLNVKDIALIAGVRVILSILSMLLALVLVKPSHLPISNKEKCEILKSAQPFALSEALSIIYVQADITLLTLLKTKTTAGVYSPVSTLINALFIIPSSIHLYAIPILSQSFQYNNEKFIKSAKKLLVWLFLLGLILAMAIGIVGSKLVVFLLGSAYEVTGKLIVILSPLLLLKSMEFGFVSNIIAMDKQKFRLLPQLIAALVNLALNIWAIPRFGEFGAAWVYLLSEFVLFIGYALVFWVWFEKTKRQT